MTPVQIPFGKQTNVIAVLRTSAACKGVWGNLYSINISTLLTFRSTIVGSALRFLSRHRGKIMRPILHLNAPTNLFTMKIISWLLLL